MPKTAVDEQSGFRFWKDEIGTDLRFENCPVRSRIMDVTKLDCLITPPAFDAGFAKQPSHIDVCPFVSSPADAGHDDRTLGF
jgi:hypothetical protein